MKTANLHSSLALLFAAAFCVGAQTITSTPTNYMVELVLSNGATYKGRVLDDVTGKPIANERFGGGDYKFQDVYTDAGGRYELRHVKGDAKLSFWLTNYVQQDIKLDPADEDSTVSVPDIRLKRGGWISGRVELPEEVESNGVTLIAFEFQGNLPNSVIVAPTVAFADGVFRSGPLPAGAFTLHADLHIIGKEARQPLQASVSNIVVIAGQDTTNVFIPMKMVFQTNSASGR